ncbi:MAG: hypothetical protein U0795_15595 [Pirellulales bacterium]
MQRRVRTLLVSVSLSAIGVSAWISSCQTVCADELADAKRHWAEYANLPEDFEAQWTLVAQIEGVTQGQYVKFPGTVLMGVLAQSRTESLLFDQFRNVASFDEFVGGANDQYHFLLKKQPRVNGGEYLLLIADKNRSDAAARVSPANLWMLAGAAAIPFSDTAFPLLDLWDAKKFSISEVASTEVGLRIKGSVTGNGEPVNGIPGGTQCAFETSRAHDHLLSVVNYAYIQPGSNYTVKIEQRNRYPEQRPAAGWFPKSVVCTRQVTENGRVIAKDVLQFDIHYLGQRRGPRERYFLPYFGINDHDVAALNQPAK